MECFESQHAEVMNHLGELQQDLRFSDFTLWLKEGPVPFSRILMAAISPFFVNLVTADMEKSRSREVHMEHVTQDAWNCITNFYFSRRKLVSVHNALDVLKTSHMYGLEKLVQHCSRFLQSHCYEDNCLDLWKVATLFELESLYQEARRVLCDNFSTVCKSENFLSLQETELLKLLEEEVVTTEDDLCQALLAWMEKNNADAETCTEVFQHLRLKLISDGCLGSHVMRHNACVRSPLIHFLVTRETTRRKQSTSHGLMQVEPRRRRPRSAKNSLLIFGVSMSMDFLVFVWSFDERKWTQSPGPPFKVREAFSCTALEDAVIVLGGTVNRSTYMFDLRTLKWSLGPDPLRRRYKPGITTIGRTAYVAGGCDFDGALSSIEEFSKASGEWTLTGSLQEATLECGVAALGDTILVVGGNRREAAGLIQTFNVRTRSAAILDVSLPRDMHHVRAASHGTTAFFVGEEGDLILVREVGGRPQITSTAVLENFTVGELWFKLQASNSCVRMVGGFFSKSVLCWGFDGKEITNDDVVDFPEEIEGCLALEVNIPPP